MKVFLPMRRVLLIICCLACCLGCSTLKTTKRWYKEYVNPTPTVDLTVQADEECAPRGFATSFVPVDTKLDMLGRDLSTQDSYPSDGWFDAFLIRYSWLDSIAAVNVDGEVLTSRSTSPGRTKEAEDLDYQALIHGDPDHRMPKAFVLSGPSGKRIALSMPFFKNNVWKGCLVALFGFDTIVQAAPSPDDLVILDAQGNVLWAGRYGAIMQQMAGQPWKDRLEDRVSGVYEVQGKRFFWLGRAFAGIWLVYTSEIREG